MSKSKIAIIGAGNIGTMIANMLPEPDYDVTVVDTNASALAQKRLDKVRVLALDITEIDDLAQFLETQTYVINAGPFFLNSDIAHAAAKTNTHYFDLTEDVGQTEMIKQMAKHSTESVFVPQCGLAPGFISIIANHLAKKFDTVEDIEMRVGALPMYPSNELKYNMTWSTDGLVNEYLHLCNAIQNDEMVSLQPLEGYETFSIDGNEYEAFNTSGGLGTLCDTWMDNVKNMNYKTVRYPGHRYLMRFLIDEMKLGENNGKSLKKLMNSAIPATNQDVVLIFVTVSGVKENRRIQETWTRKIYGNDEWSAIQLTTAAG
ncbi:hypothetical protein LCGC14_3016950, partial [marine sediment metagenome]